MRTIFLLFFGYLVWRFLIRPLFVGMNDKTQYRNPQQDMADIIRKMQEHQRKQNDPPFEHQQPKTQKSSKSKLNDGDYIDFEEVE
jgi:hypothetical protein